MQPGENLAHYEIIGLLGKGGMGEVYRALDTKLQRDVAIKVLPAVFSTDPERVARFEREATTLAKLQHTNIATIYGFEEDQGRRFLVMELVEGEDLAERLNRGPVPAEDALTMAAQIAEGLELAHNMGIVHRDLKPANIKITPLGDVKILDFGLARAFADEPNTDSSMEIGNSPTITAAMTGAGVILGTAAYMSPEQARGKTIDKQADIWSFGVVLYEMLTADRLFGGETVSDSIGAILHRDPDLTQLPRVPRQVPVLLRRCLSRDKRQRLRDIGDARLDLEDAIATKVGAGEAASGRTPRTPWMIAVSLFVVAVVLLSMSLTRSPEDNPGLATLGLPRNEAVDLGTHNAWPRIGFSPDGNQVVYIGGEDFQLYRRNIDSFESEAIPGTENVGIFTFSPDGLWIAYASRSRIWKVALSGGAPLEVCETANGPGLAWGDDEIYFPRNNGGGLWAVPAGGGEVRSITTLDEEREETSHRWPHVLPGGRHLLFTIKTARIETFDDALIGLLDLDSGEVTVLVKGGTFPRYLPSGHIVYGRDSQLFAVPFDLETLTVQGTPIRVLENVDTVDVNGCAQYALSGDGDLAYLTAGEALAHLELVWLHTSGRIESFPINNPYALQLALSPDGLQLATLIPGANDKIHIYDMERGTMARLTSTPGNDILPTWSPDGKQIIYANDREGNHDLYLVPADGSVPARRILASSADEFPNSWTPDGARVLFTRLDSSGRPELWIMPVDGSEEPRALFESENGSAGGQVSPDGAWVAYVSFSSGEPSVYIRAMTGTGTPIRASIDAAGQPRWSPEGRTLYFISSDRMMAVAVEPGKDLEVGLPEEIFEIDETVFGTLPLSSDGTRFLANRANPELRKHFGIRVMFDWAHQLESR